MDWLWFGLPAWFSVWHCVYAFIVKAITGVTFTAYCMSDPVQGQSICEVIDAVSVGPSFTKELVEILDETDRHYDRRPKHPD